MSTAAGRPTTGSSTGRAGAGLPAAGDSRGSAWTVGALGRSRRRTAAPAAAAHEVRMSLAAEDSSAYGDVSETRMRHVMSGFATGVAVVTASTPAGPAGITFQSFTSLSLDPPLISFNPTRTSTTWPRIRRAGRFCVNVLGAEQEHLARIFSHPSGGPAGAAAQFSGVSHRLSELGSPRLSGALAWIECTLEAEYDGGDHTIVVGRVAGMSTVENAGPLLYFRGGYGTFAQH
ncbi:flavin reductase family protein [Brevibacterium sp.]|uniref:flavin reductase family protein n=1 Tax=Brevibacterium sp. TaxID=1701 RepID=UPI00342AF68E